MPNFVADGKTDCIDEIELKTGKRVDGLCYSGVSLFAKIAAALTDSFGVLLIGLLLWMILGAAL